MEKQSFFRRLLTMILLVAIILASSVTYSPTISAATGTTYYVDSVSGNDSNNGTSTSTPWRTLDKVNNSNYNGGDSVLFKRGSSWSTGYLEVKSGTSAGQLTYGAYGTGNKPILNGNGGFATVSISEKEYVTVQDLEITNDAATAGDRKGVYIYASSGIKHRIYLYNLDIHNVKGKYGENDYYWAGAILSEANGGLFDDVRIENCYIHNNECQGIYTNGNVVETKYTNLKIKNNSFLRNVKGDIIVGLAASPVIEYNTAYDAGQGYTGFFYIASTWAWGSSDPLFQYNEIARTKGAWDISWGGDSQALDVDIFNSGTPILQYNYTHNNEGGALLVMPNTENITGTIYRYNISQNDGNYNCAGGTTIAVRTNGTIGTQIYNNVFYSDIAAGLSTGEWDNTAVTFKNNIFYTTGSGSYATTNKTYDYNCFYGGTAPSNGTNQITSNPQFVNPGSGGDGRSTVDGYKLQASSPCINTGVSIANNGGKDYWGNGLYTGSPDRGAFEYGGTPSTPTPTPTPSDSKLSGTLFGSTPAYDSTTTIDKAFDGSTGTYSECWATDPYVGIDLGSGAAKKITRIRFYPRSTFASRMTGGKFQGSNTSSSSGFVDLYTISSQPAEGWNEVTISDTTAYRYIRFINAGCNVAEIEFYGAVVATPTPTPTPIDSKLSGSLFGTSPAYNNGTDTYDKAYDNNTATFFDYSQSNGGYTGIDFGSGVTKRITRIKYYPRSYWAPRMTGGKFQGSNTSSSSGFVDLYTIPSDPTYSWNEVTISDTTPYRFVRYLSPDGGLCNVAEIEFYGVDGSSGGNTHQGSWAAKAVVGATASSKYLCQWPGLANNTVYTARMWVKGTSGAKLTFGPIKWNWQPYTSSTVTCNGAWQLVEVTFTSIEAGCGFRILNDTNCTAGTIYIDDCYIGIGNNGTNLLTDPSFESGSGWNSDDRGTVFSLVQNP